MRNQEAGAAATLLALSCWVGCTGSRIEARPSPRAVEERPQPAAGAVKPAPPHADFPSAQECVEADPWVIAVFGRPAHRLAWGSPDASESAPFVVRSEGACPAGTAPIFGRDQNAGIGFLSRDGVRIAIHAWKERMLRIYTHRGSELEAEIPVEGVFYAARFLTGDRVLVATSASLAVVALPSKKVVRSVPWENPASMPPRDSISPDEKWLLVYRNDPKHVLRVVSLDDLSVAGTVALPDEPVAYRFLPDGRRLLVVVDRHTNAPGAVRLLEVRTDTWRVSREVALPLAITDSPILSSDGRLLLAADHAVDLTTRAVKKLRFVVQAADEHGEVALVRPWEPSWKAPMTHWKLSEPAPEAFSGPAGPYAFHYPHVTELSARGPALSCGGGSCVLWDAGAP